MSKYNYIISSRKDNDIYDNSLVNIKKILFFQISIFPTEYKKYCVRFFEINSLGKILKVSEGLCSKKIIKKIISNLNINQYRMFNTYNLKYIKFPTGGEISVIISNLLDNDI